MRLVPVNLGFSNRTILATDGRKALQLPPATTTEAAFEMMKIADALSDSDDLNGSDVADDFERLCGRHRMRLAIHTDDSKYQP